MAGMRGSKSLHSMMIRLPGVFLVLGILCCAAPGPTAEAGASRPLFNVGYKILDFHYQKDSQEKTITVAVWYPTTAKPRPHIYGGPTNGRVAIDAARLTEKGPFPMLVFSHGYGGSGIGAVFFTEQLAARGWIVAAPDHHDRHSAVRIRTGQADQFNRRGFRRHVREIGGSGPADRDKYHYRLDEMQLVIDRMAASEDFRQVIDINRVAVGGHSFGGYTALGLCGTIAERQDPRIKAVLLFSTGAGGYLFRPAELAAVDIPSMLFMGEREKGQRRGRQTMSELSNKIYSNLAPPKYFLEVRQGNHFSFNNRFNESRMTKRLSGTEAQFEVIRRYSIAFLEKHVAQVKSAEKVLDHEDWMLTRYVREPDRDPTKQ